jgi:Family of unknown function (DUF6533)
MICTALLCYDSLLTMALEINLIWQRKFRLAVLLYGLARYGAIIFFILAISVDFADFDTIQVIPHLAVLDVTDIIVHRSVFALHMLHLFYISLQ